MTSLAPYVSSSEEMVKKMLQLADPKPGEVLYDLGSGDGRILIAAAKEYGARAVGVELRKDLVEESRRKVKELGLEDRVVIIHGDAMEVDISEADIITLYLTDSGNEKLKPKLEKNAKPGARIVSNSFRIPGWEPVRVSEAGWYKVYLYVKK